MPGKKVFIFFLLILLAAPLGAAALPQIGEEAPDFTLPTLEGKSFRLSTFLSNPGETKGVVISFFASWCKPCKYELPELEKIYLRYREQGIKIVAVSLDDEAAPKEIQQFIKNMGVTFPVVLDQSGKVARSYGVRPIPATFVLGPGRKIEGKFVGYSKANLKALEEKVRQLAQ